MGQAIRRETVLKGFDPREFHPVRVRRCRSDALLRLYAALRRDGPDRGVPLRPHVLLPSGPPPWTSCTSMSARVICTSCTRRRPGISTTTQRSRDRRSAPERGQADILGRGLRALRRHLRGRARHEVRRPLNVKRVSSPVLAAGQRGRCDLGARGVRAGSTAPPTFVRSCSTPKPDRDPQLRPSEAGWRKRDQSSSATRSSAKTRPRRSRRHACAALGVHRHCAPRACSTTC